MDYPENLCDRKLHNAQHV